MHQSGKSFPPQIKFIIGNEMCERFSFYGMSGILVIFLVKYLSVPQHQAKALFHLFTSAAYFCTLIGGYLSDRYLGKYRTIMGLSFIYCLGHVSIALWNSKTGIYFGLALIALGMGGVKSCVSAYVGDQFTEENKELVQKVFDLFYWSINFGSITASVLSPWVLANYGPAWAFGIPGILMALATFIFWLGRNQYIHVPPSQKTGNAGFGSIFMYALFHQGLRKPGEGFFDVASPKYASEDIEGTKAVANVLKVFLAISMYWALSHQGGSSWILQADQMNLKVLGIQFYAAQIKVLNPILILMLIPAFSLYIYPALERMGFKMTPLRRMGIGMFLSALSFVGIGVIQVFLDSGHKLSIAWQVIPYLFDAMAEIMISITGLEFAYTQAPRFMKGTLMSFWFLTTVLGNFLTAIVSEINFLQGASFFFFFAGAMTVVSILFGVIASRYRPHEYLMASTVPSGV